MLLIHWDFTLANGVNAPVLFAVWKAETPIIIPAETVYPISQHFKTIFAVDNEGNISVTASFAGYVTREVFEEGINKVNTRIDGIENLGKHAGTFDTYGFVYYKTRVMFYSCRTVLHIQRA